MPLDRLFRCDDVNELLFYEMVVARVRATRREEKAEVDRIAKGAGRAGR